MDSPLTLRFLLIKEIHSDSVCSQINVRNWCFNQCCWLEITQKVKKNVQEQCSTGTCDAACFTLISPKDSEIESWGPVGSSTASGGRCGHLAEEFHEPGLFVLFTYEDLNPLNITLCMCMHVPWNMSMNPVHSLCVFCR